MNLGYFKKNKVIIAILLSLVIVSSNNLSFAAVLPYMPPAGQLTLPGTAYDLPRLVGMRFTSDDPFHFTFILNAGNNKAGEGLLRREIAKIDKYFLAALTLPADELWVNLSPYENNRISTDALAATDLGKDLLGEDYVLKQLAASLTYPETESGKQYWNAVNNVGANNHSPVHQNFNKVWIVPGKIKILESKTQAVIKEATFKVMVDEDYLACRHAYRQAGQAGLAMQKNGRFDTSRSLSVPPKAGSIETNETLSDRATNAFRQHILPLIEKEVNSGERFAALRQAYSAMIMAVWFKEKLKKTILNDYYLNKKKLNGAQTDDPVIREKIYNEYVAAFNKGVYNYVKRERVETQNFASLHKITRRAYFSGGVEARHLPEDVGRGTIMAEDGEAAAVLEVVGGAIEADRRLVPLSAGSAGVLLQGKTADIQAAVQCILAQNPRRATPIFFDCLTSGPIGSTGGQRHVKQGLAQKITNALKERAFIGWSEGDLAKLAEIFVALANLYLQDTSREMPGFLKISRQIDSASQVGYRHENALDIIKRTLSGIVFDNPTGGFDFTQSVSQEIETQGAGLNFSSREAKTELAKMSGMHLETLALRY